MKTMFEHDLVRRLYYRDGLSKHEMAEHDNRLPAYRLKNANLRLSACVEDIDYRHPRWLNKTLILFLADGQ